MSALGLADYSSSDEEQEEQMQSQPQQQVPKAVNGHAVRDVAIEQEKDTLPLHDVQHNAQSDASQQHAQPPPQSQPLQLQQPQSLPVDSAPIGPAMGPAPGPAAMPESILTMSEDDRIQAPTSPYTANRLLIRNVTMPPVPNFEIPPSPPGSPPPATTAKFARFLDLKKKGVHFNERLHQSSALRNPGLLAKLMDFAGISQEDQYASALPDALAVPTKFPEWAYADKLVKEHERIAKRKEEERAKLQREAIDFVPAKRVDNYAPAASSASGSARSNEAATGRSDRPEAKRSRFDDKERKSRFDDRDGSNRGRDMGGRYNDRDGRGGRRSRSPRR